jgi:hypothetical protein
VLNGAIVAPILVPLLMAWQLFGLPWEIQTSRAREVSAPALIDST